MPISSNAAMPPVRTLFTRAVRLEQTRKALVAAAAEIVGEEGYQACSVAKIAIRAKVAQGTFYTYFASRQERRAGKASAASDLSSSSVRR